MLGRKPPPVEPQWEAMAEGLTSLGEPFRLNEIVFPPGEWIEVPAKLLPRLLAHSWVQIRQKGD